MYAFLTALRAAGQDIAAVQAALQAETKRAVGAGSSVVAINRLFQLIRANKLVQSGAPFLTPAGVAWLDKRDEGKAKTRC